MGITSQQPPVQESLAQRRLPVGAEVLATGGTHFRVWAPRRQRVEVLLDGGPAHPLERDADGYHAGTVADAGHGARYRFRLDGGDAFPDPASRFQPEGPHGSSQVIDPSRFAWTDQTWRGVPLKGAVIYEFHVGTFTPEGTWEAALTHLPSLKEMGITVLEMMPVADVPGRFNWGYDGVNLFAPTRLYGEPDNLRRFIDRAHAVGLAVILDVVYNHLGPDGNYITQFSPDYLTRKHDTDWGEAINYDGDHSGPVREFYIANAGYWIDEFHFDGLRLDATQDIHDDTPGDRNILAEITRAVRAKAGHRATIIVGENEPQQVQLIMPYDQGGFGLDCLWNDDFHHTAVVRLTGSRQAYYTDYKGTPQEFISSLKYGYLYQGQRYRWQKNRRGTSGLGFDPMHFAVFIENHDQVANTARGRRLHQLTAPGLHRAMTALMLLSPGTPMLFQGQEFNASAPFLFFADHEPDLAAKVQTGRRKFMAQFRSLARAEMDEVFARDAPHLESTWRRCVLDHSERGRNQEAVALHRDLLHIRRDDPVISRQTSKCIDGAVLSADAFVIRFFAGGRNEGMDRLLLVNFGTDLRLDPAPEPLLAPPQHMQWDVLWSSEDPRYGGDGTPPPDTVDNWLLQGFAAVLLHPGPFQGDVPGELTGASDGNSKGADLPAGVHGKERN